MAQKIFNLPESTSRTQTHVLTVPNLKEITSIKVDTGTVTIEKIEGDKVTIKVSGGSYSRREQTGGSYIPADSKYIDGITRGYASESDIPSTISYNSDGYSGTLYLGTGDYAPVYSPQVYGKDKPWVAWFYGTVTRPASDTRTWRYYYQYNVTVNYIDNAIPTITLDTTDNRTLYENDTLTISGNAKDEDVGNVVTVKYNINGGTTRAIATAISDGSNIPFNKTLIFKQNKLYDGGTAVTGDLAEGAQHTLKVWAEDDQGGKSKEQIRVFYVVPNRPAILTINPFSPREDLIDTDRITINGSISDPDNNTVKVSYKIANGSFKEVYNGTGGDFQFQVQLSELVEGTNTLTIQAEDSYGAKSVKTLEVTKEKNEVPLKTAVARYKLSPPNGTAKGVILWIEREVGDLVVDVEISMGMNGEEENFVPMTKSSIAFVREGIEEDEWTYEADSPKENIIIKITMTRTSTNSNKGITLISGVLS